MLELGTSSAAHGIDELSDVVSGGAIADFGVVRIPSCSDRLRCAFPTCLRCTFSKLLASPVYCSESIIIVGKRVSWLQEQRFRTWADPPQRVLIRTRGRWELVRTPVQFAEDCELF